MKLKTTLTVVIMAALLVGALYVLNRSSNKSKTIATSGERGVVRLSTTLSAVDYAPFYVAKKFAWYDSALKEKGFGTSYETFQGPAPANEAIAGNRIDFVAVAEPPILIGKSSGTDVRIAGISATLVQQILVRPQSRIRSLTDLKGKKVAVLKGSSSHYGLVKAAEKSGVKTSDFEIINMLPPDAHAAFENGDVDAWAIWPPWVEKEQLAGKGTVLSGQGHVIQSLLAVRGAFADEHADLVSIVRGVHERAKEWIKLNPDEAQKIVAEALKEEISVIKMAWPQHDWNVSLNTKVVEDLQAKADFLVEQKIITQPVDVRGILVPGSPSPSNAK